jgi:CheY-like chemotaxis protein
MYDAVLRGDICLTVCVCVQCVERALDLAGAALVTGPSHRIDLVLDVARDVPRWVVGDPTRLRQIFVNVISNAIKFTARGEVVVHVSSRRCSTPRYSEASPPSSPSMTCRARAEIDGGVQLCVRVVDTGVGIDSGQLAALFQPYAQGSRSTSRMFGGTGLGLAICRQLCERMGGVISLSSAGAGMGTICAFTVVLRRTLHPPQDPDAGLPDVNLHDTRVLLAVPEGSLGLMLEQWLERIGAICTWATTWGECCRRLSDGVFSVALVHNRIGGAPLMGLRDFTGLNVIVIAEPQIREEWQAKVRAGAVAAVLVQPLRFKVFAETLSQVVDHPAPAAAAEPQLSTNDSSAIPAPALVQSDTESARMLLADDSPVNLHVLTLLLKRLGIVRVDTVSDGEAALRCALSGQYAAVMLDLQMPRMSGSMVAQEIRRVLPKPPALIAVSGDACWEGNQALFDAFLVKPVMLDHLQSVLTQFVSGC